MIIMNCNTDKVMKNDSEFRYSLKMNSINDKKFNSNYDKNNSTLVECTSGCDDDCSTSNNTITSNTSNKTVCIVKSKECIGTSYIREEDGQRVQKVKTILIKRRQKKRRRLQIKSIQSVLPNTTVLYKQQQPQPQPKNQQVQQPEVFSDSIIYTRDDGIRVRRTRKIVQRKKTTNNVILARQQQQVQLNSVINYSNNNNNRNVITTTSISSSIPKMCHSFGGVSIQQQEDECDHYPFDEIPSSVTKTITGHVQVAIPQQNSRNIIDTYCDIDDTFDNSIITIRGCNNNYINVSIDTYINDKGQKIRRTCRKYRKIQKDNNNNNTCSSDKTSIESNTINSSNNLYINEHGQIVRRVRKLRKRIKLQQQQQNTSEKN